jgi:hypothetical protein
MHQQEENMNLLQGLGMLALLVVPLVGAGYLNWKYPDKNATYNNLDWW